MNPRGRFAPKAKVKLLTCGDIALRFQAPELYMKIEVQPTSRGTTMPIICNVTQ